MSSNSKAAKRQSPVSNDKQVEVGSSRGNEEEEGDYEKEESVCVTSQVCIKPIKNCRNLDKENNTGDDASVQQKRWVDDAFAAL